MRHRPGLVIYLTSLLLLAAGLTFACISTYQGIGNFYDREEVCPTHLPENLSDNEKFAALGIPVLSVNYLPEEITSLPTVRIIAVEYFDDTQFCAISIRYQENTKILIDITTYESEAPPRNTKWSCYDYPNEDYESTCSTTYQNLDKDTYSIVIKSNFPINMTNRIAEGLQIQKDNAN